MTMKHFAMIIWLLGIFAMITSCEVQPSKAMEILQGEGCSQIHLEGWSMFGCGHDDNMSQEFSCVRNNQAVRGVICGQIDVFSKGYTVRYK